MNMVPGRTVEVISSSSHETEGIGRLIGDMLTGGDVIALSGELGSGKTTLVKGIAERMGCDKDEVASPSFTLINEYNGSLPLFHIDFYRLKDAGELYEIGYDEYLQRLGVVIIEWADRLPRVVPRESLTIVLRYLEVDCREIVMQAHGSRYERMIEELNRKIYRE